MGTLRDTWMRSTPKEHPFRWLGTEPGELIDDEAARALAETFPSDGYQRLDTSLRENGKQYRNFSRPVVTPGAPSDMDLPEPWLELISDLVGPAYRADVARLLGQQPAPEVEIRLVRHEDGDWIAPHTDRDDKLFSHIIYFNLEWERQWGGCLQVLDGPASSGVVATVIPRLGTSVLMARADNSWHQVTPVSSPTPKARQSLLLHGVHA